MIVIYNFFYQITLLIPLYTNYSQILLILTLYFLEHGKENEEQINLRLRKRTEGRGDEEYITRKKSAFRFPKDVSAIFPQQKAEQMIDKRQSAAPPQILIQANGIKPWKLKKQQHAELLARGMSAAEGNQNEGGIIDMNKLANLDEFGNINFDQQLNQIADMAIDDNSEKKIKKIKEKNKGMDIEFDTSSLKRNKKDMNYRERRNKKKKSSFIINY